MDKYSKRKYYAVFIILAGLAVIALKWNVNTGVDYGFAVGENEGISIFAATQVVTAYVGRYLRVDIFFDPVGYMLVLAGLCILDRNHQTGKGKVFSVVGMLCNIAQMIIPLLFQPSGLVLPVIVLYLVQVLSVVVMMYSFSTLCTRKLDNYRYMQVGKDLRFGADLYGICLVVASVLYLFSRVGWYFAKMLYIVVSILAVAAMAYYIIKAAKYTGQLKLFEQEKVTEE